MPKNTVNTIISTFLKTGRVANNKKGGKTYSKVTEDIRDYISGIVDEDCTLSLRKISGILLENKKVYLSTTTIFNCLKFMYYTLKLLKPVPIRRNEIDVIEARFLYA